LDGNQSSTINRTRYDAVPWAVYSITEQEAAVKSIADAGSRQILGIHGLDSYTSEFIWGGAALIEQEFRLEDVKQLIFPHPTVAELIRDVVWELA
jgi:dihydrolipoamide dehydrogenase